MNTMIGKLTALAGIMLLAGQPASDRPVRTFATRSVVQLAAFAPDGKTILGWSAEGFMRWDALSGKELERQPVFLKACGRRGPVLPRSEDGRTVSVNCGAKLLFFDMATGEPRGERAFSAKQTPVVYTVAPDGGLLATVAAGAIDVVQLSDMKSPEARGTIDNEHEVQQMTFAPGAALLATGAVDGVRLWQVPDARLLHKIPNGTFHAFSPDARSIAVERGRDVGIFDVTSGEQKLQVPGTVSQLRFSGDGRLLAGWNNQQLTVWDVATGKAAVNLRGNQLVTVALSPDSALLAVVGMELAGDAARTTLAIWKVK